MGSQGLSVQVCPKSDINRRPQRTKGEQDLPKLDIPRSSSHYPEDVSPQESMISKHSHQRPSQGSSFEVSPITEHDATPREPVAHPPRFSSHIPVAQKSTKSRATSGQLTGLRKKLPTSDSATLRDPSISTRRFDEFSGNLTDTENGKPAYTSPDAVRLESERRTAAVKPNILSPISTTPTTTQPAKSMDGISIPRKPWTPEPWKGAGGRYAIVDSMADKPSPQDQRSFPVGTHRRSMSRTEPVPDELAGEKLPLNFELPTRPTSRAPNGSPCPIDQEVSKPLPLFSSPPPRTPEEPKLPFAQLPTPPPQPIFPTPAGDTRSPLARNPSEEEMKASLSQPLGALTPVSSRDGQTPDPGLKPQPDRIDPPLASRFSVTTYATTNMGSPQTNYDSPPATPEMKSDLTPPSSILHRNRPVPAAGVVRSRKPVSSQAEPISQAEMARRQSKSLPKSPDEAAATTLVATLEAKLDALRRRRQNLKTVLHELTNVVQPSSVAYDMASRAEIKKTVNSINSELATVQKEEHETGLKLHRAWKRQDQESVYEPTHLWVRRVTT